MFNLRPIFLFFALVGVTNAEINGSACTQRATIEYCTRMVCCAVIIFSRARESCSLLSCISLKHHSNCDADDFHQTVYKEGTEDFFTTSVLQERLCHRNEIIVCVLYIRRLRRR